MYKKILALTLLFNFSLFGATVSDLILKAARGEISVAELDEKLNSKSSTYSVRNIDFRRLLYFFPYELSLIAHTLIQHFQTIDSLVWHHIDFLFLGINDSKKNLSYFAKDGYRKIKKQLLSHNSIPCGTLAICAPYINSNYGLEFIIGEIKISNFDDKDKTKCLQIIDKRAQEIEAMEKAEAHNPFHNSFID